MYILNVKFTKIMPSGFYAFRTSAPFSSQALPRVTIAAKIDLQNDSPTAVIRFLFIPMKLPLLFLTLLAVFDLRAATVAPQPAIPLWPNGAPGALGSAESDIPTLTPFLPTPEKATGVAIVIFPGGAYAGLAPHEGEGYAQWLVEHGIAGIVVKYRLGSNGYHHPSMLQDATRAVRLTRSKAAAWKIDPHRVGVMGSSAGGHLASTILTHFDAGDPSATDPIEKESSRPDFGILCYPVITMGENTHIGSRENLLGKDASKESIEFLSSEKQVTAQTPPCFIWHTYDDKGVKVENSFAFAEALQKARVPYELHIYEKGGHGIGLSSGANGVAKGDVHPWAKDCLFWLHERGILKN